MRSILFLERIKVMKINIIADSDIATTSLLKQLFIKFNEVHEVKILYLNKLNLNQLNSSLNVFCRCCLPNHGWISEFMNRYNMPYVFYIDDNLWELRGNSILAQYHSSPEVLKSLDAFVQHASMVITSTSKLRQYIVNENHAHECNVIDLPNFVDFDMFDKIQQKLPEKGRTFRIGYAGSPKQEAFSHILSALKELRDEDYKFELEFVGFTPETDLYINESFEYKDNYQEYVKLVKKRGWDLALSPFLDDYFWSFKTDNKYREYSAFKIPGIYSDVEPYNEVISDGINGFLADNTMSSWKVKIKSVLDGKVDLTLVSKNAYDDVKMKYDIVNVIAIWEKCVNNLDHSSLMQESDCKKIFYWHLKQNYSPSYLVFLINIFNLSIKQNGKRKTLKKTIRFLFRGLK